MSWTRIEIDLDALAHNYNVLKSRLTEKTNIMAIVKSDAYGHGMVPVAKRLRMEGARYFGVSKLWEALELREAGISDPILVLLGVVTNEIDKALENDIMITIYREKVAKAITRRAESLGVLAKVHVKVDTGMNRLGVPYNECFDFLDRIKNFGGLKICGLFSHFSVADESSEDDRTFTREQLNRFMKIVEHARKLDLPIDHFHMANSAGLIDIPEAHFQLVRPGIALYGGYPSAHFTDYVDLQPVMSLKTRIIHLKKIPAGENIGYGRTYTTTKESVIATIPVGYDDGYSRLLSSKSEALVRGKRVPVVGRVSMNMITLDVSGVANASVGDEVVLLGKQGNETITGEELAEKCNTINYEIFCNLGSLKPKVFISSSEVEV